MIEGVVFDLDGIIIDSEPLWKIAEAKVLSSVGIDLTPEMGRQTTGLDNMCTVKHWYAFKPWKGKSHEEVSELIIYELIAQVKSNGVLKEGVRYITGFFAERDIPMAVASSSCMKIIQTVLEKFKLSDKFAAVHSSEFEEFGKPHPAVYITAARKLGCIPERCMAFEDSFYGALAAKAARMKVALIPDRGDAHQPRFGFADLKLKSFNEFTEKHFDYLNSLP